MIVTKPITVKYFIDFINNIRPEDMEEFLAGSPVSLEETLLSEFTQGKTYVFVDDETDKVWSLGGVCHQDDEYVAWCLCTTEVTKQPIKWLRQTKHLAKGILNEYPEVTNLVYRKNELHIRWLKWIGAYVYPCPEFDKFDVFVYPHPKLRSV